MIDTKVAGRVALALAAFSSLAACGLKGDLERPEPLFGDPPIDGPTDPRVLNKVEEGVTEDLEGGPETPEAQDNVPDDELLGGI